MKSKQKKTLVLVDGHAMAYRAHFAFAGQNLTDSEGHATETTFGFFRMLAKLIADRKPTHVVLCFDPSREMNPRYELYPDYKGHRPPMPDELRRQIDDIQKIAVELNLPPLIIEGAEADDTIASIIEQHKSDFDVIEIVSGDKDLYNMLYKNVVMLRSKKGVSDFLEIDEAWVKKEIGITREQVPDYMALVGDTADNVPGVKGVGEKTAAKLIAEYKTLDKIYKNIAKIKPDGLRAKLEASKDNAYISQQLVTLRKDIQLKVKPDAMALALNPESANLFKEKKLPTVASEWEKLLKKTAGTAAPAGKTVVAENNTGSPDGNAAIPEIKFCQHTVTIKTGQELDTLLGKLSKLVEICVDTETTGLAVHDSQIFGVSLGWLEGKTLKSAYIPLPDGGEATLNGDYADVDDKKILLPKLKAFLENKKVAKIGQNIKFDIQVFRAAGIEVEGYADDTMLMSYAMYSGLHNHGMDGLSERYLGHNPISIKTLLGTGKSSVTFDRVPVDEAVRYAAEDADVTLRLWQAFKPQLHKAQVTTVYETLERPLVPVLADMEMAGILVDKSTLSRMSNAFAQKMAGLEAEIQELAGQPFNVGSPKQLGEILFDKMGLPGGEKGKNGAYATGADVLEDLAAEGHDLPSRVLDWRQLSKLKSTYTDALQDHVNPDTGRVHTSYSIAGANTGRLASTDPNLQNIPVRSDEGRRIREAFVSGPGMRLVSLDYSQIELRILAHVADIPALKQAFRDGIDIHAMTASQMFGVPVEGMDPMVRRRAKAINFGVIYGISGFGLARNLRIPRAEAQAFIDTYFERFPGIREYMDSTIAFAKANGFVQTLFGRKIHTPEINAKGPTAGFARRAAINAPIQGAAADIIRRAMIRMPKAISHLPAKMLLQVHDELLFEVEESAAEELTKIARDVMEQAPLPAVHLDVPMVVEAGQGANWAEAH